MSIHEANPLATPHGLVKRIQHALLDLPVIDLGAAIGRITLAQPGQELPATPGCEDRFAARETGVFREHPEAAPRRWMLWCRLDDLPSALAPFLDNQDKPALDALSVTLAFQVGMFKENARSQHRPSRPR